MPRRPRIQLHGVPLHIVQRGHNRDPCFFGEEDYQSYLYWLREALKKESCALHGYALMTNHVHLLVTPERAEAVPRLIIALGRRYVQYMGEYGRIHEYGGSDTVLNSKPAHREICIKRFSRFHHPVDQMRKLAHCRPHHRLRRQTVRLHPCAKDLQDWIVAQRHQPGMYKALRNAAWPVLDIIVRPLTELPDCR